MGEQSLGTGGPTPGRCGRWKVYGGVRKKSISEERQKREGECWCYEQVR